jgi:hypothetical protein
MLARLHAQLHEARLDLRERWLRQRERSALRSLGEEVVRSGGGEGEALVRLKAEIAGGECRRASLAAERRASLEADRADLRAVAAWVRPAVIVRGVCTRLVLRHRQSLERRALGPIFEALGDLAMGSAESASQTNVRSEVGRDLAAVRGQLAAVIAERERWATRFSTGALPAWTARAGSEAAGFGRAVLRQLRSHLVPKAPALAGLAVGWWIASTYTDSHFRSVLRSVGIGSGGTRVVSSSTYEAMSFWLPLLAAALCAYLGERATAYYSGRNEAGAKSGESGHPERSEG